MIGRTMSVEAGAILLGAETRPAAGFVNTEVATGISGTITVVASEMTTVETNFMRLDSAVEV